MSIEQSEMDGPGEGSENSASTPTIGSPQPPPPTEPPATEAPQAQTTEEKPRRRRGFAAMDPKLVSELATRGGKAAHRAGTAHEFSSEEARIAGRKGGMATHAKRRARMMMNGGLGVGANGNGAAANGNAGSNESNTSHGTNGTHGTNGSSSTSTPPENTTNGDGSAVS